MGLYHGSHIVHGVSWEHRGPQRAGSRGHSCNSGATWWSVDDCQIRETAGDTHQTLVSNEKYQMAAFGKISYRHLKVY